jgi:lipoyl-dependent peroxiredoxin
MLLAKILNRARVKATVGRDIRVVSSDGVLDLKVTMARELDGTNGRGTNPEQLFAASYVASFLETTRFVAEREGIAHPTQTEVEAGGAAELRARRLRMCSRRFSPPAP